LFSCYRDLRDVPYLVRKHPRGRLDSSRIAQHDRDVPPSHRCIRKALNREEKYSCVAVNQTDVSLSGRASFEDRAHSSNEGIK
jgi:hypothetical protein